MTGRTDTHPYASRPGLVGPARYAITAKAT